MLLEGRLCPIMSFHNIVGDIGVSKKCDRDCAAFREVNITEEQAEQLNRESPFTIDIAAAEHRQYCLMMRT